jgi:L-alanine-DL-glutamate epimerase-like enolase superfamily enzyme
MTEASIALVEVARCAVPLAHPVRLGATVYREREYAVLRLTTTDGVVGDALGYTRGLPLAEMLRTLAPSLVGVDAARPVQALAGLRAAHVNARSGFGRAFSLVDNALWDALARRAGMPLWRLLGGARDRVPLLAVGGYFLEQRPLADVADELRRLAHEGFRTLKVHATDAPLVARLREAVPDEVGLAVDLHMGCGTLPHALALCRGLDDLGLAFIEDPFAPEQWRLTAELAGHLRTPVAAGEDALGPEALHDLVSAVSILRIDSTTCGGTAAAAAVAAVAAARGRAVMTHAFPDLHGHLAGGLAPVSQVEMIPYDSGANPVLALMARRQPVEAGELVLSEEPGDGMPLDWDAVSAHARERWTIDQPNHQGPGDAHET